MDVSNVRSALRARDELGFLEGAAAAIRRIEAFEVEVPATVTWGFAIAFDLATLTLIAIRRRLAFFFLEGVKLVGSLPRKRDIAISFGSSLTRRGLLALSFRIAALIILVGRKLPSLLARMAIHPAESALLACWIAMAAKERTYPAPSRSPRRDLVRGRRSSEIKRPLQQGTRILQSSRRYVQCSMTSRESGILYGTTRCSDCSSRNQYSAIATLKLHFDMGILYEGPGHTKPWVGTTTSQSLK